MQLDFAEAVLRGFLQKMCSQIFVKFTRNDVPWSLFFDKIAGPQPAALLKKYSDMNSAKI